MYISFCLLFVCKAKITERFALEFWNPEITQMKETKSRGLRIFGSKTPHSRLMSALIKNSGSSAFSGDYDDTLDYPIPTCIYIYIYSVYCHESRTPVNPGYDFMECHNGGFC